MQQLSPEDIRGSFINSTKGEAGRIPLPGLHEVIWEEREYLGWRDQQSPQRGYLVHWVGDEPLGLVLRASEFSLRPGIAAMCSWCRITRRSDEISMFSAPRPATPMTPTLSFSFGEIGRRFGADWQPAKSPAAAREEACRKWRRLCCMAERGRRP